MLALFKKKASSAVRAGVVLGQNEITIAVVQRRAGQKPLLTHYSSHPLVKGGDSLAAIASKVPLARAAVSAVIGIDDYQLVQAEAPEVLPSELRAAIRWRLRDAISFHIDDAVVDVFEIPGQSHRSQAKMMFAVAARSSVVQHLAATLAPIAAGLDVIDIPELCLRNLSALLPQDQRGVGLLVLSQHYAQLLLTREGTLYLARRIDFSRGASLNFSVDGPADSSIDAASLALELQRSLDYYESHFDQSAITDLVITPNDSRAVELAEALQSETSLKIALADPRELLELAAGVELPAGQENLLAIGAALREDPMQL